jgi:hypothetical protein
MITVVWLVAALVCFGVSFAVERGAALRWTALGIVVAGIALEVIVTASIANALR